MPHYVNKIPTESPEYMPGCLYDHGNFLCPIRALKFQLSLLSICHDAQHTTNNTNSPQQEISAMMHSATNQHMVRLFQVSRVLRGINVASSLLNTFSQLNF